MNIQKAIDVIRSEHKGKIIECLDFDGFFAFAIVDNDFDEEKDMMGGAYFTVDKNNGTVGVFNPTSDIKLFMSARKIDIATNTRCRKGN